MITVKGTIEAMGRFFEAMAKARVNSELLRMGREKVESLGYSYEALLIGPSAWPWRNDTREAGQKTDIGVNARNLNNSAGEAMKELGRAENDIDWTSRTGLSRADCDQDAA